MDPIRNPYAPGAGAHPPELAGRDSVLEAARIALERHRAGRHSQSIILAGLRGVGKTVLLNRIRRNARDGGIAAISFEATDSRPLPVALIPQLRSALIEMSRREAAKDLAQRALRVLAGFVSAWKVAYQDISLELDVDPIPGLADNQDLESDLLVLLEHAAAAARASGTAVALFIDELQYLPEEEMAAVITSMHGAAQEDLPLVLIGAGLPQVSSQLANSRSYAERMFTFPDIGPLPIEDAASALAKPAAAEGVAFQPEAMDAILRQTRGYPYFLQQWGKHAWLAAERSPISPADVERAGEAALEELDRSFFRIRMDNITPTEERYLRAMAELGSGPHRSSEVAEAFGKTLGGAAPHRDKMINRGMIWSPKRGFLDFTVPLFDEYLKRTVPIFD